MDECPGVIIFVSLLEDETYTLVASICAKSDLFCVVKVVQCRGDSECLFYVVEGLFEFLRPNELVLCTQEWSNGLDAYGGGNLAIACVGLCDGRVDLVSEM